MIHRPQPVGPAAGMTFDEMLERVRYEGAYPTRERAETTVREVLAALGRQLAGDIRADLAAALPAEAARDLTGQVHDGEQLAGSDFVQDLAARTHGTPATARWDAGTVLCLVASLAGPALLTRVLSALPPGYALLFGRAELAQAA